MSSVGPRRGWLVLLGSAVACGIDARGTLGADPKAASGDSGAPGPGDGGGGPSPDTDATGGGDGSVPADGASPSRGRVTDGLIALYELEENGGTIAKDTSGVAPALDLGIPVAVKWMPKALKFDVAAHVQSTGPATKIVTRCGAANAVTIEAWIRYVDLPDWSRIVSLSESNGVGNVAMTSNPGTIGFDLRTTSDAYLRSTRDVYDAGTPTGLVHLVETRNSAGTKRVYLDGALVIDVAQTGDFSGWDATYPLSVGNTPALDRPFFGEVHLVAVYDRALSSAEVATNRNAGADP